MRRKRESMALAGVTQSLALQTRNMLRPIFDLDARVREIVADGLAAPAKVATEEGFVDGVEAHSVLGALEAVPLVGIDDVRDGDALGLHRGDDLVGLGLLH